MGASKLFQQTAFATPLIHIKTRLPNPSGHGVGEAGPSFDWSHLPRIGDLISWYVGDDDQVMYEVSHIEWDAGSGSVHLRLKL